jgi:hypothetical protein
VLLNVRHLRPDSRPGVHDDAEPVRALDLANGSADRDVATFENTS